MLRDVTAEHLRQRMRSHRDRFETIGQLVRGLAHQLGNPLAAVKTSGQVLQSNFDRFDRDKKEVYLERMLEGIDRIQGIVDRILEHQQWQIGALEQIPITPLLDQVRSAFAPEMRDPLMKRSPINLRILCTMKNLSNLRVRFVACTVW